LTVSKLTTFYLNSKIHFIGRKIDISLIWIS